MKNLLLLALSLCILYSCSTPDRKQEKDAVIQETENQVSVIEEAVQEEIRELPSTAGSKIRKGVNLEPGKVYTDTLSFLSFNSDYDYWYALFLTSDKDSVSLVYNDIPGEELVNKLLIVSWKLDSLYEAGEGDELYFQERMLSYEIPDTP